MSAAPPPGAQTRIAARRTMDAGEPLLARVRSVTATARTQRGRDHCISLASVTGDVIAITARRRGARIVYRIVDEWGTAFSVVRVTTDRPVYRLRRPVRITLTETNTSDHEVAAAIGCQILHSS